MREYEMYSPMFKSTLGKQIIPKLKVLQNNDYTVMAEIVGVTDVVLQVPSEVQCPPKVLEQ